MRKTLLLGITVCSVIGFGLTGTQAAHAQDRQESKTCITFQPASCRIVTALSFQNLPQEKCDIETLLEKLNAIQLPALPNTDNNCGNTQKPTNPVIPEDSQKPTQPETEKPTQSVTKPEQKPTQPETEKPTQSVTKPEQKPTQPETEGNTEAGGTQTPGQLSYAEQVVKLVNEERAKAGLSELALDKTIESAALIRAKEIQSVFSHTRPNGSAFHTALTESGVKYRGSGENIAWGQKSPEAVMKAWMNSPGHRANILNKNYTKIGVGYLQNASGVNYWVQLFTY